LKKHILSERSESQGSIFCDGSDIWTEVYSFVLAECIQLNSKGCKSPGGYFWYYA